MNSHKNRVGSFLRVLAVAGFMCFLAACAIQSDTLPAPQPSAAALKNPDAQQQEFATPEKAVEALVVATRSNKQGDLQKILGVRAGKLIHSGDKVADEQGRKKFLAAYDKAHEIENEDDGHKVLVIGEEKWPMPIQLAQGAGGWWFDTTVGEQEILNRRIGRNELNVIEICRAYVEAQQEFSNMHTLGAGHEYAQRFQSTEDRHDGLYWPAAEGQSESPFGELISMAAEEGYGGKVLGNHAPYEGYYYKILKSQGSHASGGAREYVADGHMTRGFALIAYPARYGDSGVMSFIVNQNGIVYEKNLGPDTAKIARRSTQYDPDGSWNIVR
jgi:hypothetical protein